MTVLESISVLSSQGNGFVEEPLLSAVVGRGTGEDTS